MANDRIQPMQKSIFRDNGLARERFYRRPSLELVEERCLLATISWDGEAGDNQWATASNWVGDLLPGPRDDVVIPERFAASTIISDQPVSINTIDSKASLRISRNAFNLGDSASDISRIDGSLVLSSTLVNGGMLFIDGSLEWTAGKLSGDGKTIVGGGAVLMGSAIKTVEGHTLELDSDTVWSQGTVIINDRGLIRNLAGNTFDVRGNLGVRTFDSGTFQNDGTLLRSIGNGHATWNVDLQNTKGATVHVDSGTLSLSGTSSNSGRYEIDTTIAFSGGPHQQHTGGHFVGMGLTRLVQGSFLIHADLIIDTRLSLEAARLTVDAAMTVNGPWTWTAGQLRGEGSTTTEGGLTLKHGTEKQLIGHRLQLASDTVWDGGSLRVLSESTIQNRQGNTFEIRGNLKMGTDEGGALVNEGRLVRSTGTGNANFSLNVKNEVGGIIEAQSGTVGLTQTSANFGTYNVGANMAFSGGPHLQNAGSSIIGDGTTRLKHGTFQVNSELVINSKLSIESSGARLAVADSLTVIGPWRWTSGQLVGAGRTKSQGGLNITHGTAKTLTGHRLELESDTIWDGGSISLNESANIKNVAGHTFDIRGNLSIHTNAGGVFENEGRIVRSAGESNTTWNVTIENKGEVEIQTGILNLPLGYTQTSGQTRLAGGNLSSSQLIDLQGGRFSGFGTVSASVKNAGRFEPDSSAMGLNISGVYSQSSSGVLQIDISGPTAKSQYDQLNISGQANIAGTLEVNVIGGFVPGIGNTFDVVKAETAQGEFQTYTGLAFAPNKSFVPNTNAGDVTLTVEESIGGNASATSAALQNAIDALTTVNGIRSWAAHLDLAQNLPLLPEQFATNFGLEQLLGNWSNATLETLELSNANTFTDLNSALVSNGFSILCLDDVGPNCDEGDLAEVEFIGSIPLTSAETFVDHSGSNLLSGLGSYADLQGELFIEQANLNVKLVIGVDNSGPDGGIAYYFSGNSNLQLTIDGQTSITGDGTVASNNASLTGTADTSDLIIQLNIGTADSKYRSVLTIDQFAIAISGSVDLSVVSLMEPATLTWKGVLDLAANTISAPEVEPVLSATLALPGMRTSFEGDESTPLLLVITGSPGPLGSWTFDGLASSTANSEITLFGFGVDQLDYDLTIAPQQFHGSATIQLNQADTDLAGFLPVNVESVTVAFASAASVLDEFEITAEVRPSQSFKDNMPFTPILCLEIENCQLDPEANENTTITLPLHAASLQPPLGDPRLAFREVGPVTVGFEDWKIGDNLVFDGQMTIGRIDSNGVVQFLQEPNHQVTGFVVLDFAHADSKAQPLGEDNLEDFGDDPPESGQDPSCDDPNEAFCLDGGKLRFGGSIVDTGDEVIATLDFHQQIDVRFKLGEVMELYGVGFDSTIHFVNPHVSSNPSVNFAVNQVWVDGVRMALAAEEAEESGQTVVFTATGTGSGEQRQPAALLNFEALFGDIQEPLATFGELKVLFPDVVAETEGALGGSLTGLRMLGGGVPDLTDQAEVEGDFGDFFSPENQFFSWLPFRVDRLGIQAKEGFFSRNEHGQIDGLDDSSKFTVTFSGGFVQSDVGEGTPFPITATVTDLELDMSHLKRVVAGEDPIANFPITDLNGVSIAVDPFTFFEGAPVTFRGLLSLGKVELESDQDHDGNVDAAIFGRVLGDFAFEEWGGGIDLVLSDRGPLVAQIHAPLAYPLGNTGLMLSGVSGGISFGVTELRSVNDPLELVSDPVFIDPLEINDQIIRQSLERLIENQKYSWQASFTIGVKGQITTLAMPGLLTGEASLLANIVAPDHPDKGQIPELRFLGTGNASIYGFPLARAGILLDFAQPLNPELNFAFAAPSPGSPLGLVLVARARVGMRLDANGLLESQIVAMRTIVETGLEGVLSRVAENLESDHSRPLSQQLLDIDGNGIVTTMGEFTEDSQEITSNFIVDRVNSLLPKNFSEITAAFDLTRALEVTNGLFTEFYNAKADFEQFLVDVQTVSIGVSEAAGIDVDDVNAARDRLDEAVIQGASEFDSFQEELASAARQAGLQLWEGFQPTLGIRGDVQPTLFGIATGEPYGDVDVIVNKSAISFSVRGSITRVLLSLNPTLAPLLHNLPTIEDRLQFGFSLDLPDTLVQTMLEGGDEDLRQFMLEEVSPFGDWEVEIQGEILNGGFRMQDVSGIMFGPQLDQKDQIMPRGLVQERVVDLDPDGDGEVNANLVEFVDNNPQKIPVARHSDFEYMMQNGGILLTGQLFAPAIQRDPAEVISRLQPPPINKDTGQPYQSSDFNTGNNDIDRAYRAYDEYVVWIENTKRELMRNVAYDRIQMYVPSPAQLFDIDLFYDETNLADSGYLQPYSTENDRPVETLFANSGPGRLPIAGEPFDDLDGNGSFDGADAFLDVNRNGHWDGGDRFDDQNRNGLYDFGEPFESVDGVDGLSGELWIDLDGDGLPSSELFQDTNGDGVFFSGGFFEDLGNGVYDLGEDYQDLGNGVPNVGELFKDLNNNGIFDPDEEFTDLGNGYYDGPEPSQDFNRDGMIDPTSEFIDLNGNGLWDAVGEPFIDVGNGVYDGPISSDDPPPRLQLKTGDELFDAIDEISNTFYVEGIHDDKLLGIDFGEYFYRISRHGIEIESTVPWLAGAKTVLYGGHRNVVLNDLLMDVPDPLRIPDSYFSIPVMGLESEISSDKVNIWLKESFNIPTNLLTTPEEVVANASFSVWSPGFEEGQGLVGGIEAEMLLNLPGLVENGSFKLAADLFPAVVTPTALVPTDPLVLPRFDLTTSGDGIGLIGLSEAPDDLLSLQDFEITVGNRNEADSLQIEVSGRAKLFSAINGGLNFQVDGQLLIDDNGSPYGELSMFRLDQNTVPLGFSEDSIFSLIVDPVSTFGPRVQIDGDLTFPGLSGFEIKDGLFHLGVENGTLGLDASGLLSFLGTTFNISSNVDAHLDISEQGFLTGALVATVASGDPFEIQTGIKEMEEPWQLDGQFGLQVSPGNTTFTADATLEVPTLETGIEINGSFSSDGSATFTSTVVDLTLFDPASAFDISGEFIFERAVEPGEPTVTRLQISNAFLGWGEISMELSDFEIESTGRFRDLDGEPGLTIPKQLLDLTPPDLDLGMTWDTSESRLEVTKDSFNLSFGESNLEIPGFPDLFTIPEIPNIGKTGWFVTELSDHQINLDIFQLDGSISFERLPDGTFQLALAGQEFLGAKFPPFFKIANLIQTPILTGPSERLVIHVDGTFVADLVEDTLGSDLLGIDAQTLTFQKTTPDTDSIFLTLLNPTLTIPLVDPIEMASIQLGHNGEIEGQDDEGDWSSDILLEPFQLGQQFFVTAQPLVELVVKTVNEQNELLLSLVEPVAINVLELPLEFHEWAVSSGGTFKGLVQGVFVDSISGFTLGTPDLLPRFKIERESNFFTLNLLDDQTVDLGFVHLTFPGGDNFISSNGNFNFEGSVDLNLGNNDVIGVSGHATAVVSSLQPTTISVSEVSLDIGLLGINQSVPDFNLTLDGTLESSPLDIDRFSLGHFSLDPDLAKIPMTMMVNNNLVSVASTIDILFEVVSDASLDFSSFLIDSVNGFSADVSGALALVGHELESSTFEMIYTTHDSIIDLVTLTLPESAELSLKNDDQTFLEIDVDGGLDSDGSFEFSGSADMKFDFEGKNSVDGEFEVTLNDSGFSGTFDGSAVLSDPVTGNSQTFDDATGSLTEEGCLHVSASQSISVRVPAPTLKNPFKTRRITATTTGAADFPLPGGTCEDGFSVSVTVTDGYIGDATVFFDANANGIHDFLDRDGNGRRDFDEPMEPIGITTVHGFVDLYVPSEFDTNRNGRLDPNEGRLVVTGGMDLLTNIPLRTQLTAPVTAAVVTPLTTLTDFLSRLHQQDINTASSIVKQSLGLGDFDILQSDPIFGARSLENGADLAFQQAIKLQNTIVELSHLLSGAGLSDTDSVSQIVVEEMTARIFSGREPFNLGDSHFVESLLIGSASRINIALESLNVQAAGQVIAQTNRLIDLLSKDDIDQWVFDVARVAHVAQGEIAHELRAIGNGSISASHLLASYTGQPLMEKVNAATVGRIVPFPLIDFNGDDRSDDRDIDALCQRIHTGEYEEVFDLNNDGRIGRLDMDLLIEDFFQTGYGDSNLDGVFDSRDLVETFIHGEYEDEQIRNSTWVEGDWNCDGDFNSSDFVFAFVNGSYVFAALEGRDETNQAKGSLSIHMKESFVDDRLGGLKKERQKFVRFG